MIDKTSDKTAGKTAEQRQAAHALLSPRHLRIDLDRSRWCENDCEQLDVLKESENELELLQALKPFGPVVGFNRQTINRRTTQYEQELGSTLDGKVIDRAWYLGFCRTEKFSGFPPTKF